MKDIIGVLSANKARAITILSCLEKKEIQFENTPCIYVINLEGDIKLVEVIGARITSNDIDIYIKEFRKWTNTYISISSSINSVYEAIYNECFSKLSTKDKLNYIKNLKEDNEYSIKLFNNSINCLLVQLFYEHHKIEYGKPFIFNNKKIINLVLLSFHTLTFKGFYETEYGMMSKKGIIINMDSEIEFLESEH